MNAISFKTTSWTTAAFFVVFLFGFLYSQRINCDDRSSLGEDSCTYFSLARSIQEGKGLRSLWIKDEPPHAKMSAGYPLLMVPVIALNGADTCLVTYEIVLLTVLSLLLVFFIFRREESDALALGLSVLVGFNATVFLYGRSLLSEIPFLFWTLLVLFLFHRASRPWGRAGLAVALLMAFLTRSAGIFLIVAVILRLWFDSRKQGQTKDFFKIYGIFLVFVLLPVVWWLGREILFSRLTHVSYLHEFIGGQYNEPFSLTGFFMRCLKGGYAVIFYAVPKALTNLPVPSRSWLMASVSFVTLGGLCWSLVKKKRVMDIYAALYLVFACTWPWVQMSGLRFVIVLLPFLLYYFFVGIREGIVRIVDGPDTKLVSAGLIAIFLGFYILHSPLLIQKERKTQNERTSAAVYEWVKANTPETAVFVAGSPVALYHYTGRRSADLAMTTFNAGEFKDVIKRGLVDFVFFDETTQEARLIFIPVLMKHAAAFKALYSQDGFRVYRIVRDKF